MKYGEELLASTSITLRNIYKNARMQRGKLVGLQKSTRPQVTFVEKVIYLLQNFDKVYLTSQTLKFNRRKVKPRE